MGCPVRVGDLRGPDCPVAIPIDFPPGIGCWRPEQVTAAASFLEGLAPDRVGDASIAAGVREVRRWLDAAACGESEQTRWLREATAHNPEDAGLRRTLGRRAAVSDGPRALVGFYY